MALFGRSKNQRISGVDVKEKNESSPGSKDSEVRKKELASIFKDLGQKEINLAYQLATIRRLQTGETLFNKGDSGESIYMVLEGKIRVMPYAPDLFQKSAVFGRGDMVGIVEFVRHQPRFSSAVASEPAVVMAMDRIAMTSLDYKTQFFFYKRMAETAVDRADLLETEKSELAGKNLTLVDSLYTERADRIPDYRNSELIRNIISKIPQLPVFVHSLATKLVDVETSSSDVVGLIKQDPSLVADVLKTVNSSYYGLQQKVSDINSAVLLLGFRSLYQLVVAEGIRRTMPDTESFRQLHSHALAVSYIAFTLSMSSGIGMPVHMATIGLLHNIGESVAALLIKRNPNLSVFIDALDHAALGALLLDGWNLPAMICETVQYQEFPEFSRPSKLPKEVTANVSILYLAKLCFDLISGTRKDGPPRIFLHEYKQIMKWETLSLKEITEKVVLPDLRKRRESLPVSIKSLIEKYAITMVD